MLNKLTITNKSIHVPWLSNPSDVLDFRGGGEKREETDAAVIVEEDICGVYVAEVVRMLLEVTWDF